MKGPRTITLLSTMKCTATCNECCFNCSPSRTETMSIETLDLIMKKCFDRFSTIESVVFSGGEPTLFPKLLEKGIQYAAENQCSTRIVSNGHWGKSFERAEAFIANLKAKGLKELNISTGDEHQKYVPFKSVAIAATTAAKLGIDTIIAVETNRYSKFSSRDIFVHEIIEKYISENKGLRLSIHNSIWDDLSERVEDKKYFPGTKSNIDTPCDYLFGSLAFFPDGSMYSCCGITALEIDELRIGNAHQGRLYESYIKSTRDFIKIWLNVEGPIEIIKKCMLKNSNIDIDVARYAHKCDACSDLFNRDDIKQTVYSIIQSNIATVMQKKLFSVDEEGRNIIKERILSA